MQRLCLSICCLPMLLTLAWGEEKKAAGLDARALAPFLDERTVAVLHLDMARLDVHALHKQLAPVFKLPPVAQDTFTRDVTDIFAGLKKQGVTGMDVIYSLADLPQLPPFFIFHGGEPEQVSSALTDFKRFSPLVFEVRDKVVVGADKKTLTRLREEKPVARPDLDKAFAAAEPGLINLVLLAGPGPRRIVEEMVPALPQPLGGGSIKVLTQGLQWIVLRVDAAPKLDLHVLAQAADHDTALALRKLAEQAVALAAKQPPTPELGPIFENLGRLLKPEVDGARVTFHLEGPTLIALLQPVLAGRRNSALQAQSMNNLKQLVLAMHYYHDTNGHFPAYASQDKQGKPLLSWRVQLLPFIEHDKLYREFHLDEPWDSVHNKKLISRMPNVFASPTNPKLAAEGKTTYLAPLGKDTMFSGFKTLKLADVTDGTSYTILLVDAADDHAVIWTKPDDLTVNMEEPHKGLSFKYEDRFLVLFADGSVRALPRTIPKATLRALFTPVGGEVIKLP